MISSVLITAGAKRSNKAKNGRIYIRPIDIEKD
jgi:hypothetical protein